MADPRFFRVAGPFSVAEIATLTGAEIAGAGEASLQLEDVGSLENAGPHHLSFLSNRKYRPALMKSGAGAAFVHPTLASTAPPGMTVLVTPSPYRAFALAAQAFHPLPVITPGIAASAVVDPSAEIGEGVAIGANAVVGADARIGPGSTIGPGTVIGDGVVIGSRCRIGANVTISHALIGDRVTLLPGVCVGQDGFGFAPDQTGHVRIPQLGRVIIGDDVEVGANVTIDRGAGPDTVIGDGCMIDNLVQIGHNVTLGRGCILVAQSGIAGSTHLDDFVSVGGQAAIIGHLEIGRGARIAGKAGVIRDVAPGATMGGVPAVPMTQWLRQSALLARLVTKKDA